MAYIELSRGFHEFSSEEARSPDFDIIDYSGLFPSKISWGDLEKEQRVVILAPAGSGKTEEFKGRVASLRTQGRHAFFLRIENLALQEDFEIAFEEGSSYEEFEKWRQSTEKAWFFLDSVDEAKLKSHDDFVKAIKKFSCRVANRLPDIHLYISSRPPPQWSPASDSDLLNNQFRVKRPKESSIKSPIPESKVDDLSNEGEKLEESDSLQFKIFTLSHLNKTQQELFAEHRGVTDVAAFFSAVDKHNIDELTKQVLSFSYVINYWNEKHELKSTYEIYEYGIHKKLLEKAEHRKERSILSFDRALEGVQRLAAAATFCGQSNISSNGDTDGLNARQVLSEWRYKEQTELLSKAIFDNAGYGGLRFHSRVEREFLAAQWVLDLKKSGKTDLEVGDLFFNKMYDHDIVRPSTRSILPWLATEDPSLMEQTLEAGPEIFFEGGDATRLPPDTKVKITSEICERVHCDKSYRSPISYHGLSRLASKSIEADIFQLFEKYKGDEDVWDFLLGFVWHANMESCAGFALEAAQTTGKENGLTIMALTALSVVGTPEEQKSYIRWFLNNLNTVSHRETREVIEHFFPTYISVEELLRLVESIKAENIDSRTVSIYILSKVIGSLNETQLTELLAGFHTLLQRQPFKNDYLLISKEYGWVFPAACKCVEKLVSLKSPTVFNNTALHIIRCAGRYKDYSHDMSRDGVDFHAVLDGWFDLKAASFWYDVQKERKPDRPLTSHFFGAYEWCWQFTITDASYFAAQISEQVDTDNKLVALNMAFHLYEYNERPDDVLEKMRAASQPFRKVHAELSELLKQETVEEHRQKQEQRESKLQKKQYDIKVKKLAQLRKWQEHLSNNVYLISCPHSNTWNAREYLYGKTRRAKDNRGGRWGISIWKELAEEYSSDIAQAYREGLVGFWLNYQPLLYSEHAQGKSNTCLHTVLGLSGLAIEAKETENWSETISLQDAVTATRYALWEMNSLPDWFPELYAKHYDVIEPILLKELKWQIHQEKDDTYIIEKLAWYNNIWSRAAFRHQVFEVIKTTSRFPSIEILRRCLTIAMSEDGVTDKDFTDLAQQRLKSSKVQLEHRALWFAVWIATNPESGISALESEFEGQPFETSKSLCEKVAVNLVNTHTSSTFISREEYKTVSFLKRLYILFEKYIRRKDDINRETGVTNSSGLRDNAQDARHMLFTYLTNIPGQNTYNALIELSKTHPYKNARPWMLAQAHKRAERDGDFNSWSIDKFKAFAISGIIPPKNAQELFDLAVVQLANLQKQLEDGDYSIANLFSKQSKETEFRNYVCYELRERSRQNYHISPEEELADAKRPDLRFHGTQCKATVPVEIKIADRWTYPQLLERLENQLCNDYHRDSRSEFGIYLLAYVGGRRGWPCPKLNKRLKFNELIVQLQTDANKIIQDRKDIKEIRVIGIDLTKRQQPKRTVPQSYLSRTWNGTHGTRCSINPKYYTHVDVSFAYSTESEKTAPRVPNFQGTSAGGGACGWHISA